MRRSVRVFASGKGRGAAGACSGERREHLSRQLEPELAIRTIISLCSTWPQSTRSSLQSRPHSSLRYVSQDIGLGLPSFTHSCILPLVHCRGEPGIGTQSRQGPGFGSPQLPLGRRRAERSAEASLCASACPTRLATVKRLADDRSPPMHRPSCTRALAAESAHRNEPESGAGR